MVELGNTIFVSERNPYTGDVTVSPAIVTHVYDEKDGDPTWWNAAKDKAPVDAVVIRRNGTFEPTTIGSQEMTTDPDTGEEYSVGYAMTPDGHSNPTTTDTASTSGTSTATPTATTDTGTTAPVAGSTDPASVSGAQTGTVGDGTTTGTTTTDTGGTATTDTSGTTTTAP